ncbi:MAG: hypothetical protein JSW49_02745 [candidate division WOR-3 bacterium]|nr:MAG: hypothetical protein JSW49_02745 [candidate division WOR-3 bacterium]
MKWNRLCRTSFNIVLLFFALLNTRHSSADVDVNMVPENTPIFVTVTYPAPHSEINTILLGESIRAFGGSMANAPIWCMVPEYGKALSESFRERASALNIDVIPFEAKPEIVRFFFAADIEAAALAESLAIGKAKTLIWLSSNTLILHEPSEFILPQDRNLGYRPVHHTNVGSLYDNPLDEFWALVYQSCGVREDYVFPMRTHVDDNIIRPYFNAGILVTRPEQALLRRWKDTFLGLYREPQFLELYKKDNRYHIFIHQALLSGIILSSFSKNEIYELPPTYNYPIHLYAEDTTEFRPQAIDDLITIRHENFYLEEDWRQKIPFGDRLKHWLIERIE